ncbi:MULTISPECIES: ABC transporter ATP-binding protein/permease [unclassified Beijerinckia]|uniref:ABC transporter ATP-binding protein/permease n=1 Tax=unclassified Beijerinckia TaxID=2638183 RepID=UPI0008994C7B|nr:MULTISPECIES: ABC transporter ATP-binding protein/permease [unclassified Beijerinckia]MDH7798769.1 putative ATP-binding cassette transporter [Beijerinckia sp. GAS462]SED32549.1 putative ATP-binding cassette transporter [Beijerinckia sp. 28-YEA-48]
MDDLKTSSANQEKSETPPIIRNFFSLSGGFWRGESALRAWTLTFLVVASQLAQIGGQVGLNAWNRIFFDALEHKSLPDVWVAIAWVPFVVIGIAASVSALVVTRMLFQTRWREWLTNHIAGWWIADQRYYRLGFVAPNQSAPEYRIADDVRLAIEPLVELALGLFSALITAATFAAILWQVAGSAQLTLGTSTFDIPAYMAIAAVIYAAIASTAAYVVGKPLVPWVMAKNEAEAQFRAEMTRLRENAESIALIRGDKDELGSVKSSYADVVTAWLNIIRQQGVIAIVLNTNGGLFPIVPLLLVVPKYLAGDLSLGAVMQVVAAFNAVQGALVWFVDNIVRLAEWYASAGRVSELGRALNEIDLGADMEGENRIELGVSDDGAIHLNNLSIADLAGRVVIKDASTRIEIGEKVLVTGESGSGKSTLIRAMAGLWPWGSGSIKVPLNVTIAFVPQKPYLPLGTLREALVYPSEGTTIGDDVIHAAMKRCGLSYLSKRLDEPDMRWDQTLSGGERQRVAFCRLLIQKPQIIIMDEATSALDEESQESLLSLLREDLAEATVLSVGHRTGIEEFHDRKIVLEKRNVGAHMTSRKLPRKIIRLFRRSKGS